MRSELPPRYEALSCLGKGGGGEVWAVRDRYAGGRYALKLLAPDATEGERAALVREAVALSGLEGLGVPAVLHFGQLPTGRPFLVRELVEGTSLDRLFVEGAPARRCLAALASAAEQATLLHRAGLLHGDIKPANIIVEGSERATLVDLGLAAPWRDRGTAVRGLTPRYAAPELLDGGPLTVRAEVYALGVTLVDILDATGERLDAAEQRALEGVARRATCPEPGERHPSADEFASALRRAGRLREDVRLFDGAGLWPIVGIENTASRLVQAAVELSPGAALVVSGAPGSGRSVLLRRLAWSLGIEGRPIVWCDASRAGDSNFLEAELGGSASPDAVTVLVDDAERLEGRVIERLETARKAGARLVVAGSGRLTEGADAFMVPPLNPHVAGELLRRGVPSLTDRLVTRVIEACEGRPGALRRFVRLAASEAVVCEEDVERLLGGLGSAAGPMLPSDPLERAASLLDRGRYNDARAALEAASRAPALPLGVARARLALGLGEPNAALDELKKVRGLAEAEEDPTIARAWTLYFGRAHVGVGDYARALEILEPLTRESTAIGAEALAYQGLAFAYLQEGTKARAALDRAVEGAQQGGLARVEAIASACLGLVLQRSDDLEAARAAYERAIYTAEQAGDAGTLGTAQLNLAGLLKIGGDIAGAMQCFEAAVDMGRRSGRRSTVRHALLNLANTDLYLGRLARARSSIEALAAQRDQLPPVMAAQLKGLEAELHARSGETERAVRAYAACAEAYEELGLGVAAAEARLEAVLVAARGGQFDSGDLGRQIHAAEAELAGSQAHRCSLALARATLARAGGDEALARNELENALEAARAGGHKDWIWRTLDTRAEIEEAGGQPIRARRDREEALAVLEDIAVRLPRDLREVFWNDPRRRRLRAAVEVTLSSGSADPDSLEPRSIGTGSSTASAISELSSTPLERRLARILEINAELLGEIDVERLAARVTDHAVDMLRAERGLVVLKQPDGGLTVHTSRSRRGGLEHEEFSRSVAQSVVETGEPVVSLNARSDARMQSYASVHALMLESVACVPIMSRSAEPIGALYVETRLRPGVIFERELPTLRAFADQVGIAIETSGLIRENQKRAEALAEANQKLRAAQAELQELLGEKTAKLKQARRKLRDAHDTLYGHFGYQGLVGTSAAMRRVYALIDRIRAAEVPVLITGESGTGKELAARAIHRGSPRAKMPFLAVNCGAIPEHLLESELFGHVRGAFTGADRDRKGLFREAEGGTVLLDEIGEMPHKMQTGLLRVLQEGVLRPVGGAKEEPVDVRVLFATHRDLGAMVADGRFREDLYYRIHVVELRLPPLRERVEDIPPLVDHFLGLFAARYKRERGTVSREAMRRLAAYDWPGNVRQLEHVLLNAWVLSESAEIEAEDIDLPSSAPAARASHARSAEVGRGVPQPPGAVAPPPAARRRPRETVSRHRQEEKERILRALEECNWNRVKAAEISGIPRRTFYRRLREYGIQ